MSPYRVLFSAILALALISCQSREQTPVIATVAAPTRIPASLQLPLHDDFADNRFLWPTGKFEDEYQSATITLGPDRYLWRVQSKKGFINRIYPENSPVVTTSSGFTYSLETKTNQSISTHASGIAIIEAGGRQGEATEFVFLVAGDEYEFARRANRVGKKVIGRTVSPAISRTSYNKLALSLSGNMFTLMINDVKVSTIEVDDVANVSKFQFGIVYSQDKAATWTNYEFDNYEVQ